MRNMLLALCALAALGMIALCVMQRGESEPGPGVSTPATPAAPNPAPKPKQPRSPRCPNCPHGTAAPQLGELVCPCGCGLPLDKCACCPQWFATRQPVLGGPVSPDGKTHIVIYESAIHWPANIASKGLGCCSMRALDYCARLQNEPRLVGLPELIRQDGIAGGGWPEKIDDLIKTYDPDARYWNDTTKCADLLYHCWLSKRLACVDYAGHDPHYSGGIAHCVCVAAYDPDNDWVAVLDDNFPSLDQIVWMGVREFSERWHGWCYGLFNSQVGALYDAPEVSDPARAVDVAGVPTYGLTRSFRKDLQSTVVDGRPGTTKAILDRLGGEMVPKIEPKIDSKVTIDPAQMLPIGAMIIAGAFVLWVILDTRTRGR